MICLISSFSEMNLRECFNIEKWIERAPQILGEELLIKPLSHPGHHPTNLHPCILLSVK